MPSWLRRYSGRPASEPVPPASAFTAPIARATEAWRVLESDAMRRQTADHLLVLEGPDRHAGPAAVWPLGQVFTAAIDLARLDSAHLDGPGASVAALRSSLERYRVGEGYGPFVGARPRYYDDNAWIGLALIQLFVQTGDEEALDASRRVLEFVREGADPEGGVRWVEGQVTRNTCSTGPAAELALRLSLARPDEELVDFARLQVNWLDRTLVREDGLYGDHLDERGVDSSVFSYNQGTPLGAYVLLHRATGDDADLDRAQTIADAALREFGLGASGSADRLWSHQPAFNAVFLRNLLALHAAAPEARIPRLLAAYLDRVWAEGRDPQTGWFTAGGIGSYDGRPTIDQAALVQLFALQALPAEQWPDIS